MNHVAGCARTLGAQGMENRVLSVCGCWLTPDGDGDGGARGETFWAGARMLGLVWVADGDRPADLQKQPGAVCTGCSCAAGGETTDSKQLHALPSHSAGLQLRQLYSRRACFSEVSAKVWDPGGSETQGNSFQCAFHFLSVTWAESTSLRLGHGHVWAPKVGRILHSDPARSVGQGRRGRAVRPVHRCHIGDGVTSLTLCPHLADGMRF